MCGGVAVSLNYVIRLLYNYHLCLLFIVCRVLCGAMLVLFYLAAILHHLCYSSICCEFSTVYLILIGKGLTLCLPFAILRVDKKLELI